MTELSLHILDIAQNSIAAKATFIEISVVEDLAADSLKISVRDNGAGMGAGFLKKAASPFVTTRTTRKIGLGLSLFKSAAEGAGGSFKIRSKPGGGTEVAADFIHSHIDRQPLGDIAETIFQLVLTNAEIDFLYTHKRNSRSFFMDTREIKRELGGVPLGAPEVVKWLRGYLDEGERELK